MGGVVAGAGTGDDTTRSGSIDRQSPASTDVRLSSTTVAVGIAWAALRRRSMPSAMTASRSAVACCSAVSPRARVAQPVHELLGVGPGGRRHRSRYMAEIMKVDVVQAEGTSRR